MSKGMNFLTSLLLFAAGVAIFIFLPVFQLDLGSQALKSETLLEYYENLIKDIQNVIESKPSAKYCVAIIGLPLAILSVGGGFKGIVSGILGIISLVLFKDVYLGNLVNYSLGGYALFVVFGLSILFGLMTLFIRK